jgi:hypothetical protein
MNAMPTAAAAGKIDVGGDLRVNRLGFGAMRTVPDSTARGRAAGGRRQPTMSTGALAEDLKLVEEDLTRFRETAADLRRRIGDPDEEPTDAAERSALIEAAEEQEALIDQLEARRQELLRRLGQPIRTNGS